MKGDIIHLKGTQRVALKLLSRKLLAISQILFIFVQISSKIATCVCLASHMWAVVSLRQVHLNQNYE